MYLREKMKKLKILYEDKYLIAVYKESNLQTIRSEKYENSLFV